MMSESLDLFLQAYSRGDEAEAGHIWNSHTESERNAMSDQLSEEYDPFIRSIEA